MRAQTLPAGLALALVLAVPAVLTAQEPLPGADSLRLRPGDALRLEVGNEPDLNGDFSLDASGAVLLPVVGLVRVEGLSAQALGQAIQAAFSRQIVDAAVRVTPLLRISVLGEVRRPGLFPVDPTMTLRDLIATAGGLAETADARDVRLLRGGATVTYSLADGGGVWTVPLRSGDRVEVGRRGWVADNLPLLVGATSSVTVALITALILR